MVAVSRLFTLFCFLDLHARGGGSRVLLHGCRATHKTWGYPVVPVLFCLIAGAIVLNTIVNDFKNSSKDPGCRSRPPPISTDPPAERSSLNSDNISRSGISE
jgi:hypothetical protein